MDNLPVLLPNTTPLVSRFFTEMSKKRQRFDQTKDEVAFLICFLFDHLASLMAYKDQSCQSHKEESTIGNPTNLTY
jgi:hypothetical protein